MKVKGLRVANVIYIAAFLLLIQASISSPKDWSLNIGIIGTAKDKAIAGFKTINHFNDQLSDNLEKEIIKKWKTETNNIPAVVSETIDNTKKDVNDNLNAAIAKSKKDFQQNLNKAVEKHYGTSSKPKGGSKSTTNKRNPQHSQNTGTD